MNKGVMSAVFAIGFAVVLWVAWGFWGTHTLALFMTFLIGVVYVLGALELQRFRAATASLSDALQATSQTPENLAEWLARLPASLQPPVRQRIEGERVPLPGPSLTPYLVGLLVMLGMLGTFLGMVVTFQGTTFALEVSSNQEAIRSALVAPIKGLGMSFGTSIAGVAASAMLGLLSALSRRERLEAIRWLDARVATVFRPFSAAQQRQDMVQALHTQAQVLPLVVERLESLVDSLERRHEQLSDRLTSQQQAFQQQTAAAYQALASSVSLSLKDSLNQVAVLAQDTMAPVVERTMVELAQHAQAAQVQLSQDMQTQLTACASQWDVSARQVADVWLSAQRSQAQAQEAMVEGLNQTLSHHMNTLDARTHHWLNAMQLQADASQKALAASDQQRLQTWAHTLESSAAQLSGQWQALARQTAEEQQGVCHALQTAAQGIITQVEQQVSDTLGSSRQLMETSDRLVSARIEEEAQWAQAQQQRMQQWLDVWRCEMQALRDQEAQRGQAAVERLDHLQAAVAGHLASLGASLEAPLTRLLNTVSEVPQAAAQVITQLREEVARQAQRENATLAERNGLMEQLHTLLQTVNDTATQQRVSVDEMVSKASALLSQAAQAFSDNLKVQTGQVQAVAHQVAAGGLELAGLSEAFGHGVGLFAQSSEQLIQGLQRIEQALGQSMQRSDEQLAYYVAQAREVIDLSISAQQGIVEDLQRLHGQAMTTLQGAA